MSVRFHSLHFLYKMGPFYGGGQIEFWGSHKIDGQLRPASLGLVWCGLAWLGLAWVAVVWLGSAWLALAGFGLGFFCQMASP